MMRRAEKFVIPPNWQVLFNDLGIELYAALTYAELPLGLFEQEKVLLSPYQYFKMWQGLDRAAQDQGIDLALKLAEVMSFESFDGPVFVAICSPNLNAALKRLQQYKPLIGPMDLELKQTQASTELAISCYGELGPLPNSLNLTELVFFTQLARLATRHHIKPTAIYLPEIPDNHLAYSDYFGCQITCADKTGMAFSSQDAIRPFLTSNQTMLTMFERDLTQKLEAALSNNSITSRVYSHLLDLLPQGESSIETMALRLAMSKRTLQRKLAAEGENYQTILHKVRKDLATYYLKETELPIAEVSFLLGFQESNSFIRAYKSWTGMSLSER